MPAVASDEIFTHDSYQLECMDVWGGNQRIQRQAYVTGMDVWVWSEPAQADRGGDVYMVSMCGGAKISRFLLADVAGHDEKAAEDADYFRKLLRKHINKKDQTKLARALNRDFEKSQTHGKFVTALLATFLPDTGQMVLCNAGHPRPLIYRALQKNWSYLDVEYLEENSTPNNLPIGVIPETEYVQFSHQVQQGDLIFYYTDGVTEAHPQGGSMLGEKGLLDLVRTLDITRPDGLLEQLHRRLSAFCGDNIKHDDLTMMLFAPDGQLPKRQSIGTQLKVVAKMAGLYKS